VVLAHGRTSAPCLPVLSCSKGAVPSSAHTHHRVAGLDLWRLDLRADQEQLLALRWLQHQVVGLPIRHHPVFSRHGTAPTNGSVGSTKLLITTHTHSTRVHTQSVSYVSPLSHTPLSPRATHGSHTVHGLGLGLGLGSAPCTSHPGVLGSIPKREEPGKTGAPCIKVPGSSRVPPPPCKHLCTRSCSNKHTHGIGFTLTLLLARAPLLLATLLSHTIPFPRVH
jgi:hypothetical protein